ncbi:MAG: NAD(P)H-hydrate dehydratase [Planctomycetaceae bacterium]|nr:NAD(P)H-hydrate dehydratase [Planctomycetaceae bacterium]
MTESRTIERIAALPDLPPRASNAHKGTFGKAMIVAGSRGMSGAACLAGQAALRGGAGLVAVATPSGVLPIVAGYEPSYLTVPLQEDVDGRIALSALSDVIELLNDATAGAIGPGLGRSADLDELVHSVYRTVEQPLVVDADALNALVARPDGLTAGSAAGPRVLTPHPGEFARLTGQTTAAVQSHREEAAIEFAAKAGVILVLKGAETVITDGLRVAINPTGNSGLATGGTGDVLTGLITSLLAQGLEPFVAAQWGAYLHGLAGDIAASELSQPGLIASDLPRYLAAAWQRLGF